MAVILKIVDIPRKPLTVDSTLIFADSTLITADTSSIVVDVNFFSVYITPRFIVDKVMVELYDELTEKVVELESFAEMVLGKMRLSFSLNIKENSSYQMTVRDLNNRLLWRGKAFATTQSDIKNFEFANANKVNNIIKL